MPEDDDAVAQARAREDAREGKAPSTQAGEFVREEIEHVRKGKHGARNPKQAIAIGLSKARRAGVNLPPQARNPLAKYEKRLRKIAVAAAIRERPRKLVRAQCQKLSVRNLPAQLRGGRSPAKRAALRDAEGQRLVAGQRATLREPGATRVTAPEEILNRTDC